MNAIGYIRISQKDQSNYSLENQERQIREYCEKHSLNLLASFKDDGESSYSFDRPDFKALEAFIKKSRSVQYLIIFDHDRFSRNLAEALIKIKELQDKYSIKVLATTDDINTDFSDPSTFLLRAFKYMIAESELHRIRKRTKDGLTQAALSGRFVNKAPYGYINARDPEGKPVLLIDEEKALHVRTIYREYIKGSGVEECRRIAAGQGFKSKGNSSVQRILSNPIYAGLIKVHTKHIKGIHAPIVSEPDYWFVQQRLNSKHIATQNRDEVPLRGVLRSAFGQLLTAGNSRGKLGRYYWYYVDKRNKLNFPADKLHRQFGELLSNLSLDKGQVELTKEIIKRAMDRVDQKAEAQKLAADIHRLEQRITNTETKYLLQADISQATYNAVITDLRAELARAQTKLAYISNSGDIYGQYLRTIPVLSDVKSAYEQMDLNGKHEFINVVFDRSLYYADSAYRTPFLHYAFQHKEVILKEKRLLLVEQPFIKMGETPRSRESGNGVEPFAQLEELLNALSAAV